MPHQQHCRGLAFGQTLQSGGTLPHLTNGTGCTGEIGVMEGLDAVDDRHGGPQGLELLKHQVQIGFRQQLQIRCPSGEPLPTQLHLLGRFLCADVQHGGVSRHGRCALKQQRALPNARVTPHQHQGTRHQPASEHPIELSGSGLQSLNRLILQRSHRRGAFRRRRLLHIRPSASPPPIADRLRLLNEGIPAAALRTTPKELA